MISNSISDKYLVSKGYLKYNIRPFRKSFKTHLPFDYVIYPLLLLYYNQWTLHSKPTGILLKPCAFVIPQVIIETIAEKKTDLITWRKGWSWYHSFITLFAKMLVCRLIIGLIRKVNKDNLSLLHDEKS
jgi:hypothetical protein